MFAQIDEALGPQTKKTEATRCRAVLGKGTVTGHLKLTTHNSRCRSLLIMLELLDETD